MKLSNPRLERIRDILACPHCKMPLELAAEAASCAGCTASYAIREGKIHFVETAAASDPLDSAKSFLKAKLGRYYYSIGLRYLAPTFPFDFVGELRRFTSEDGIVVEVGSGNQRHLPGIVCVDSYPYPEVDIVCDVTRLPFATESVDAVASRSVLEHIRDPFAAVAEMRRITKPYGTNMHLVPFIFPFHASPDDFFRFTHRGMAVLYDGWDVLEQRGATGPVTLFLVFGIELLATLTSFGSRRLKAWSYLALCALTFPFKFLDALFVGREPFSSMSPTIFTVARKPARS